MSVHIIAGTYERILYGFKATLSRKASGQIVTPTLEPVFMYPAHTHSIKALACSSNGSTLVSGSFDEVIRIYDLRSKMEQGSLQQHEGTITAMDFHSRNMVSAAEDGKICIWRTKDWECLKSIRGHQGRINALSIHPTGKLALSVGSDRRLRCWDLTRGIKAAASKLFAEGENVLWNDQGDEYAIVYAQSCEIQDVLTAKKLHSFNAPRKILSSDRWSIDEEEGLVYGLDNGEVCVHRWPKKEEQGKEEVEQEEQEATEIQEEKRWKAHDIRIKGVKALTLAASQGEESMTLLATASSDGLIRLWDLKEILAHPTTDPAHLAEYNTKSRITCLALAPVYQGKK